MSITQQDNSGIQVCSIVFWKKYIRLSCVEDLKCVHILLCCAETNLISLKSPIYQGVKLNLVQSGKFVSSDFFQIPLCSPLILSKMTAGMGGRWAAWDVGRQILLHLHWGFGGCTGRLGPNCGHSAMWTFCYCYIKLVNAWFFFHSLIGAQ